MLGYRNLIPYAETLDKGALANIRLWQFEKNHTEYLGTLRPIHFELYDFSADEGQQRDVADQHSDNYHHKKSSLQILWKPQRCATFPQKVCFCKNINSSLNKEVAFIILPNSTAVSDK